MSDMLRKVVMMMSRMRTYATWNPSDKSSNITLSNGNLSTSQSVAGMVRSTIGKTSGKWYWEVTINSSFMATGAANGSASVNNYLASDANGWSWSSGGSCFNNNALSGTNSSYTTGDILGFALDVPSGTLTMYKNGVLQSFSHTGLSGTLYASVGNSTVVSSESTTNFGATALTYTPPSGYNAGLYT